MLDCSKSASANSSSIKLLRTNWACNPAGLQLLHGGFINTLADNGARESIVIHGVDFILAALSHRLNLCRAASRVPDLRAKTVDLRKAYKQLPISLDSLNDSFLCVKEPSSGKPLVFNCKVLPFGARAAVTGFCRASHAVWFVGTALMSIHWSVYFDDFMVIEDECLSRHTNFIIDGLFSLLGCETSKEKGCAFDSIARALGVVFDMSDTKMLSVKVLNSPHRCKEIGGHLERILQSGKSSRSELGKADLCREPYIWSQCSLGLTHLKSSHSWLAFC